MLNDIICVKTNVNYDKHDKNDIKKKSNKNKNNEFDSILEKELNK